MASDCFPSVGTRVTWGHLKATCGISSRRGWLDVQDTEGAEEGQPFPPKSWGDQKHALGVKIQVTKPPPPAVSSWQVPDLSGVASVSPSGREDQFQSRPPLAGSGLRPRAEEMRKGLQGFRAGLDLPCPQESLGGLPASLLLHGPPAVSGCRADSSLRLICNTPLQNKPEPQGQAGARKAPSWVEVPSAGLPGTPVAS